MRQKSRADPNYCSRPLLIFIFLFSANFRLKSSSSKHLSNYPLINLWTVIGPMYLFSFIISFSFSKQKLLPSMVHAKMLLGSTQVAASKKVSACSFLSDSMHTTPYNISLMIARKYREKIHATSLSHFLYVQFYMYSVEREICKNIFIWVYFCKSANRFEAKKLIICFIIPKSKKAIILKIFTNPCKCF